MLNTINKIGFQQWFSYLSCNNTIFYYTVIVRELLFVYTLHGCSVDKSCHMLKVYTTIKHNCVTCDSICTTPKMKPRSTTFIEDDVYGVNS